MTYNSHFCPLIHNLFTLTTAARQVVLRQAQEIVLLL
jgi:hypothetical protein